MTCLRIICTQKMNLNDLPAYHSTHKTGAKIINIESDTSTT
jgi:hypothetical protein